MFVTATAAAAAALHILFPLQQAQIESHHSNSICPHTKIISANKKTAEKNEGNMQLRQLLSAKFIECCVFSR
jgi:hypothetical protein